MLFSVWNNQVNCLMDVLYSLFT